MIITAESDRFLYNMMRLLSGTLVQAAAAWLAGPGRGLDELTLRLAEVVGWAGEAERRWRRRAVGGEGAQGPSRLACRQGSAAWLVPRALLPRLRARCVAGRRRERGAGRG